MEFAKDFVDNPAEKIQRVLEAVNKYSLLCDSYRIAPPDFDIIPGLVV